MTASAHNQPAHADAPVKAASVLLFRGDDVLLIKRAGGANTGLWSAPGGHLATGETPLEAAHRELREETGLTATSLTALTTHGVVVPAGLGGGMASYEISVFMGTASDTDTPVAASDAAEAEFVPLALLHERTLTAGLADLIAGAAALLRSSAPAP